MWSPQETLVSSRIISVQLCNFGGQKCLKPVYMTCTEGASLCVSKSKRHHFYLVA